MSELKMCIKLAHSWTPKRKNLPFHLVLTSASKQLLILFYKDLQAECLSKKEEGAE